MRALLPLLLLLAVAGCARSTSIAEETRASARLANAPNIVLVLLDDLEVDAFRFMPRTQALVADSGVRFDSAFVSAPLCCPSRVSLLRGQYAHNTGVLANAGREGGFEAAYRLGVERSTLATWLSDAGYRTALVGKYLNNYPERDNPRYVPPGWRHWAVPVSGSPYAGFDYVLNVDGELRPYGRREEDYTTDVFRDLAVDFIEEASRANVPFFTMLSTYAPHAPSTPAPRHASMFDEVHRPASSSTRDGDRSDKPSFMRDLPVETPAEVSALFDEQYRQRLQSLQAVDEAVARLVETLRALGELDRTLFIVTSDNGYHFDLHGLWRGKETPYEEDLRVPLVMRGLGISPGRRVAEAALNIDLAPTILDLAGIRGDEAAVPMDGRSLAPLLKGDPPASWRRAFLVTRDLPERLVQKGRRLATAGSNPGVAIPSELGDEASTGGAPTDGARAARRSVRDTTADARRRRGPALTPEARRAYARIATYPSFRGVRTSDGWLYVRHGSGDEELYDMTADPSQFHNLLSDVPRRTPIIAVREWLRSWTDALASCKGDACRSLEDRGPGSASVIADPE